MSMCMSSESLLAELEGDASRSFDTSSDSDIVLSFLVMLMRSLRGEID
jgi:hypothetical protein